MGTLKRFAHISDIHLGYQQSKNLRQVEQKVFEGILKKCLEKKVNFILITGDLFHSNIPDIPTQRFAFKKFKEIHETKIPIYVVYGNHDYSPIADSVIDILTDIGYLVNVTKLNPNAKNKTFLEFTIDSNTNVKLTGISGRTSGLHKKYFEDLNREALEKEQGLKIFLFHSGIDELKIESDEEMESIPLSLIPKNFDYYAGGHIHIHSEKFLENYGIICYPGTSFAGNYNDLEENSRNQKRGFMIVDFDSKIRKTEFVEVSEIEYELIECNASSKTPNIISVELLKKISRIEPRNKIIIIKVWGEMKSGKTTEIDFSRFNEELINRGAIEVKIHRRNLSSKDYKIIPVIGGSKKELEDKIFQKNIQQVKLNQQELIGKNGINLAKDLLLSLKQSIVINEKKNDYQTRIKKEALNKLGFDPI